MNHATGTVMMLMFLYVFGCVEVMILMLCIIDAPVFFSFYFAP